ncbi:hypothetical protein [Pseudomonas syringae]|uniref:hypothetical protein n=1 Tax=Pseudomonas syringae TaxID=317 RepID=UPI0011BEC244|nr:hypothetical protein [Pseudomonas syringae]
MGPLKCILIRMTSFGSGLRLRSFFCALVVSLSCLFSVFVYAVDFTWTSYGIGDYSSASSASSACDARGGLLYSSNPKFVSASVSVSGSSAVCTPTISWSDGTTSVSSEYTVSRYGDTCPTGTYLSSTTGGCERPKETLNN